MTVNPWQSKRYCSTSAQSSLVCGKGCTGHPGGNGSEYSQSSVRGEGRKCSVEMLASETSGWVSDGGRIPAPLLSIPAVHPAARILSHALVSLESVDPCLASPSGGGGRRLTRSECAVQRGPGVANVCESV